MRRQKFNLRIFPAFVMHKVLGGAFPVGRIRKLRLQDFGFVEQLMMKAKDSFIFCICLMTRWSHGRFVLRLEKLISDLLIERWMYVKVDEFGDGDGEESKRRKEKGKEDIIM